MTSVNRRDLLRSLLCAGLGGLTVRPGFAARRHNSSIQVGAQTNTWGAPIKGYDHLLEILDALARLGYTGFETNYMSVEPQSSQPADCRRAFESRHIQFVAAHGNISFVQGNAANDQLANIRRIANYTAAMGATHLIASGTFPRNASQQQMELPAMTDLMNSVGQTCKTEGLKFCYHNHTREMDGNPPAIDAMLRDTDASLVWLNYDIGNAYPAGPNPAAFSAQHFRRIAIYHIKDVKANPAGGKNIPTDLGAGSIDIAGVIAPLEKNKWRGWLVVERESNYPKSADNPEALLKQCREYLRRTAGV